VTLATDDGSGSGVPLATPVPHTGRLGWTPFHVGVHHQHAGQHYLRVLLDRRRRQTRSRRQDGDRQDRHRGSRHHRRRSAELGEQHLQKTPQDVTLHPADTGGSGWRAPTTPSTGPRSPTPARSPSPLPQPCRDLLVDRQRRQPGGFHTGYVNIDTVAPTTAAALTPAANGAGWNSGPVTLSLHGDDPNGCGVMSTEYRLVGASTWTPYTLPILITGDGVTSYEFAPPTTPPMPRRRGP